MTGSKGCEVILIRRTFCGWIVIMILMLLLPWGRASAASMDSAVGRVAVSSGMLNVRKEPSTTAQRITALPKGSLVTLISRSGAWWKVEYGRGQYGYCHGDYIKVESGTARSVVTSSGNLNVRSGPSTSYNKVDSLSRGTVVLELGGQNGWSQILYHGIKTGYVSTAYLSGGYGGVFNEVPVLKQMDPRWAEKEVGTSGKPFSQIGCATTAIAMVESRRRGYTIYPDVMSTQLRYTPSGSVYWPEWYRPITQTGGFLERIYDLLRQGKAVLFGATNGYGKQHWVVITGFMGGDKLTASGFTIQDPGSSTRGNLQQLLNEYPNVYKFFDYA